MKRNLKTVFFSAFISAALFLLSFTVPVHANRAITVVSQLDGKTIKDKFSTGTNYAVVIGINTYSHHPDLSTPLNDARALAGLLEDKYFFNRENIFLIEDTRATKDQIMRVFRDLVAARVKKGDNVLIYYAGHGWFDDILKSGYWVTTEATKSPATFLENNTIYKFIAALDERGAQHVLLVSDSCFSGAFTREHRAVETDIGDRYFREKYARPSRNVLTSGGIEPVEDAGKAGHSVFAYYFLKTLRENPHPYLSAKQVGVRVEELVTRNSTQTPFSRFIHGVGDEGGQFFFIASSSGAIVEGPSRKGAVSTLSVEANVSGAVVLLDGSPAGSTPLADTEIAPGGHTLRVVKRDYEPYRKRIQAEPGRSISLYVDLKPALPRKARLFVETDPDNADVEITNINRSFYPGIELEAGRYHVEVAAQGHEKKDMWVTLDPGEDKSLSFALNPLPTAEAGQTFTNSIGMKFILIPSGSFMMGSSISAAEAARKYGGKEEWYKDEHPQHEVALTKSFYMQTTEVTVGQWRAFINDTGHKTEAETGGGAWIWTGKKWEKEAGTYWDNPGFSQTDSQPVTCVSWNDAQAFIKWLNRKEDNHYRLPTEAEREYACRAESATPFCYGNDKSMLKDYAWYWDNSNKATHPVGQKKPNDWGLYDMHGNVWEWCQDWYGEYKSGHVNDPLGPSSGKYRVLRGGGWSFLAGGCRSASRYRSFPGFRGDGIGFRVARDL